MVRIMVVIVRIMAAIVRVIAVIDVVIAQKTRGCVLAPSDSRKEKKCDMRPQRIGGMGGITGESRKKCRKKCRSESVIDSII